MKKERLTIEDRLLIEELLRLNYKLKDIAKVIGAHSSTISREIKARRVSNKNTEICTKTERFPFICSNCTKNLGANIKGSIIIIKRHKRIMIINLNTQELELI